MSMSKLSQKENVTDISGALDTLNSINTYLLNVYSGRLLHFSLLDVALYLFCLIINVNVCKLASGISLAMLY